MYSVVLKRSNSASEIRNAAVQMLLLLDIIDMKDKGEFDLRKPDPPLTGLNGLNFSFSTKAELLENAFKIYGAELSSDSILDRCSKIWDKWTLAQSGSLKVE